MAQEKQRHLVAYTKSTGGYRHGGGGLIKEEGVILPCGAPPALAKSIQTYSLHVSGPCRPPLPNRLPISLLSLTSLSVVSPPPPSCLATSFPVAGTGPPLSLPPPAQLCFKNNTSLLVPMRDKIMIKHFTPSKQTSKKCLQKRSPTWQQLSDLHGSRRMGFSRDQPNS